MTVTHFLHCCFFFICISLFHIHRARGEENVFTSLQGFLLIFFPPVKAFKRFFDGLERGGGGGGGGGGGARVEQAVSAMPKSTRVLAECQIAH